MKKTWKLLPKIFRDQFKLTEAEAIQILQENLFDKSKYGWKYGSSGKLGGMWQDPIVVSAFTHVLAEEDKIAKTVTRKKVYAELFKSKAFGAFIRAAGLKIYKSHSRCTNDYSYWKALPIFKPSWQRGTITVDKYRIKHEKKLKEAAKILEKTRKIKR